MCDELATFCVLLSIFTCEMQKKTKKALKSMLARIQDATGGSTSSDSGHEPGSRTKRKQRRDALRNPPLQQPTADVTMSTGGSSEPRRASVSGPTSSGRSQSR